MFPAFVYAVNTKAGNRIFRLGFLEIHFYLYCDCFLKDRLRFQHETGLLCLSNTSTRRMRLRELLYLLVLEPVFLKGMSVSTSVRFLKSSTVASVFHKAVH